MKITETIIDDCYIINQDIIYDERGWFAESFNPLEFKNRTFIDFKPIQENYSLSYKNVIRGLHFQKEPFAQSKLIKVVYGEIFDVCVDLRKESKTFGEILETILTPHMQLFIPPGCAHGFQCLTECSSIYYLVDNIYYKEFERGIIYNDYNLNIKWKTHYGFNGNYIISQKDLKWPGFLDCVMEI